MLSKLRILLEYHSYPVWLYDEDGDVINTLLPEELRADHELDRKFDDLQARYDALFIDTAHEFSFIGFSTEAEKELFLRDMDAAVAELVAKVGGRYPIINDIHLAFPQDADNNEEPK